MTNTQRGVLRVAWLAALAACGSVTGNSGDAGTIGTGPTGGDGGTASGSGDGGTASRTCFGTFANICLAAAPSQPLTIAQATTIDTASSTMCAALVSGGDFCVVAATDITISATVRGTGARPLVLLASDTLTTGALIDVGSHRGVPNEIGSGADAAACAVMAPLNGIDGGSGGSFAGAGGGGAGGAGGVGSSGAIVTSITTLRGGCPGQDGGSFTMGGTVVAKGGTKGHGGGALYLIAGVHIEALGGIQAGGEGATGGAGTPQSSEGGGGGGGGAGGMIVFDAPSVVGGGTIIANGGAGGGGAGPGNSLGTTGGDANMFARALSGNSQTTGMGSGGLGGEGSFGAAAGSGNPGVPGDPIDSDDAGIGGGGGGGGAGFIKAPAGANLGPNVSPAATP